MYVVLISTFTILIYVNLISSPTSLLGAEIEKTLGGPNVSHYKPVIGGTLVMNVLR